MLFLHVIFEIVELEQLELLIYFSKLRAHMHANA